MVERRLKALKFKTFLDKDRSDNASVTGFDAKDAKAAFDSTSMLVLWSKAACTSDWVRAAASVGRARDILVQIAIEDCEPYAPFSIDETFDLRGWKGRTITDGWRQTVKALGGFAERPGVESYLDLDTNNAAARGEWSKRYADDPLSDLAEKRLFGAAAAKAGIAPPAKAAKPKAPAGSAAGAVAGAALKGAAVAGAAVAGTAMAAHAAAPDAGGPRGYRTEFVGLDAVEEVDSCAGRLGLWPAVAGIAALLLLGWVVATARGPYIGVTTAPASVAHSPSA